MFTEQLEAQCRQTSFIGDAAQYPAYTQIVVLNELNNKLQTVFEDIVTQSRSGYWLKSVTYTSVANDSRYMIPDRACVGALEKVEVSSNSASGPFYKLDNVPTAIEQDYRLTSPGNPYVFTLSGNQVDLIPTPTLGQWIRLSYYIRPSRLVPAQSDPNGTVRGLITFVDPVARTITVNAVPFDQSLTVPVAITSAQQRIDVVSGGGWHELALVGATQTLASTTFTVGGSDSMLDIKAGDYVRVAEQTDWPCLPEDFHATLANLAAAEILRQLKMKEAADDLDKKSDASLQRFRSMITPRVKSEPKQIGIMRRSRGWGGYPYRLT